MKILKIISDDSSLWDNKEENAQGMCILGGKIRDMNSK